MADFTSIFGNEIKVVAQPRRLQRQFVGFPGAEGLAGMYMGTRGYKIAVTGRLVGSGGSYDAARADLQTTIDAIEAYYADFPATYTFKGTNYNDVILVDFKILTGRGGKAFFWTSEGYMVCDFVATMISLI